MTVLDHSDKLHQAHEDLVVGHFWYGVVKIIHGRLEIFTLHAVIGISVTFWKLIAKKPHIGLPLRGC
jgi:hypothetical protein